MGLEKGELSQWQAVRRRTARRFGMPWPTALKEEIHRCKTLGRPGWGESSQLEAVRRRTGGTWRTVAGIRWEDCKALGGAWERRVLMVGGSE